jgi:hypothetical protein
LYNLIVKLSVTYINANIDEQLSEEYHLLLVRI